MPLSVLAACEEVMKRLSSFWRVLLPKAYAGRVLEGDSDCLPIWNAGGRNDQHVNTSNEHFMTV